MCRAGPGDDVGRADGPTAVVGRQDRHRGTQDQVRVGQPLTEADDGDRRDVCRC